VPTQTAAGTRARTTTGMTGRKLERGPGAGTARPTRIIPESLVSETDWLATTFENGR
jgi:hypothetical protein